jgi:hypothetical protein
MEFKTTRDFYKSNQILTRLKKLSKENMKLKEMIKNGNPVKCCRCVEVDVWKKRCYSLSDIVINLKKNIEKLEDDVMYLT